MHSSITGKGQPCPCLLSVWYGKEKRVEEREMSDTEKRCVGFPGDADLCGRSERIEIANGNRNSFSASRDDSRDPAVAHVLGPG